MAKKKKKTHQGAQSGAAAQDDQAAVAAIIQKQQRLLNEAAKAVGSSSSAQVQSSTCTVYEHCEEEVFKVRKINFLGRPVSILLQNRNGPCALLAVANGLLLRRTFQLHEEDKALTSRDLLSLLTLWLQEQNSQTALNDPNVKETLSQLVEKLPQLLDGLLVNCRFASCTDFEYTAEVALFDLLDLKLYHAWVEPRIAAIATCWNALSERLALCAELRCELERSKRQPKPEEDEQLAYDMWLKEWLDETRCQVTPQGLSSVMQAVKLNEVCVLFRNNHFNTLYKTNSGLLCTLLTDVSFEEEESAVWETIEVDGSCGQILAAGFKNFASCEEDTPLSYVADEHESSPKHLLLQMVKDVGFTHEQAEAGLAAVDWSSAEEAIEAILESGSGIEECRTTDQGRGSSSKQDFAVEQSTTHQCPACSKEFGSKNGLISHRLAKGH